MKTNESSVRGRSEKRKWKLAVKSLQANRSECWWWLRWKGKVWKDRMWTSFECERSMSNDCGIRLRWGWSKAKSGPVGKELPGMVWSDGGRNKVFVWMMCEDARVSNKCEGTKRSTTTWIELTSSSCRGVMKDMENNAKEKEPIVGASLARN